jgi:sterol desaturase/sphingolipid hydroxylase (fatty acid hydroxylase superfamily)
MLKLVHPSGGIAGSRPDWTGRRRAAALLLMLHGIELIGLFIVAGVTTRLGRSHPGHGAGLPPLMVLAAMALVGWQGYRLLRGRWSLNVSGLVVQSAILTAAIAVATQYVGLGGIGIVVACAVLAGWGRLAESRAGSGAVTGQTAAPVPSSAARASQIGIGGAVLALLTALLVLAALSVRGGIVFGLVVFAVIFIPLERMFALHPRRVFRQGWRTDLVHYLVNGAALKIGLVVAVVAVGGALRVFVPAPLRMAVGASPGWAQIVAGLAIAMVGGYAGHRAAHEVPLLWRFHRVHHSVQEMDWLAANHLHPLDETYLRAAAVLPLYALGFGRLSLGAFIVLITLQAIFIHSNVRMTFGPLRWVIATPQFHHWHHAREPQAYNSNYAGEFPVLDALFGTLYLPADRWPEQYGVDNTEPAGYLRQLAWPLRTPCAVDSEATRPQLVVQ